MYICTSNIRVKTMRELNGNVCKWIYKIYTNKKSDDVYNRNLFIALNTQPCNANIKYL